MREILKDVLSSYLQEEKYEPELCRQMTKTISEVSVHYEDWGFLKDWHWTLDCFSWTRTGVVMITSDSDVFLNSVFLQVVKARVKDLMIPRYKIIVMISIGQLAEQNVRMASRCVWDAATDTFSSYAFKNSSLFAVANVYAVYFE